MRGSHVDIVLPQLSDAALVEQCATYLMGSYRFRGGVALQIQHLFEFRGMTLGWVPIAFRRRKYEKPEGMQLQDKLRHT